MRALPVAGLSLLLACSAGGLAASVGAVEAMASEATVAAAETSDVTVIELAADNTSSTTSWLVADDEPFIIRYGSSYALFDAQGNQLTTEDYGSLSQMSCDSLDYNEAHPYFRAAVENGVNKLAVVDSSGARISDYAYGDLYCAGEKWVLGIVLEQCDEVASESGKVQTTYRGDGNLYAISSVDVFFEGTLVGSIDGEGFGGPSWVEAHGDYLVFETQSEGSWICIDPSMNYNELYTISAVDSGYWQRGDEYYEDADGVARHISGIEVGTPACTIDPASVECPYIPINDGWTIVDLQGNEVARTDFRITSFQGFSSDGYGIVRAKNADGTEGWGVIDESFQMVVPAIYDEIGDYSTESAPETVFCDGLVRVVTEDGKFGYCDETGAEVLAPTYADSAAGTGTDRAGGTLIQDIDGSWRLVSARHGLLERTYADYRTTFGCYRSSLFVVQDDSGMWGAIDCDGNVVVPFAYKYWSSIQLAADGSFALVENDDDSATLYVMSEGNTAAATATAATEPAGSDAEADAEAEADAATGDATGDAAGGFVIAAGGAAADEEAAEEPAAMPTTDAGAAGTGAGESADASAATTTTTEGTSQVGTIFTSSSDPSDDAEAPASEASSSEASSEASSGTGVFGSLFG